MLQTIIPIYLGGINCYLLPANEGFILIDSGTASKRDELLNALSQTGCTPGRLKLILLTHGDTDHVENCAYLQKVYNVPIGIHPDDAGMVKNGDMSWNRKKKPDKLSFMGGLIIFLSGLFTSSSRFEPFTPDLSIGEGFNLREMGVAAEILHLPGHSKGSIGILTDAGDLICGDLVWNLSKPKRHFLTDDMTAFNNSIQKIKQYPVKQLYPGHGKPFTLDRLLKNL